MYDRDVLLRSYNKHSNEHDPPMRGAVAENNVQEPGNVTEHHCERPDYGASSVAGNTVVEKRKGFPGKRFFVSRVLECERISPWSS